MTVVIKLAQAFPNTHGASMGFGKDGHLYIAWGDGGGPAENLDATQRLDSLFGKVLRIDVSKDGKYSVPTDSPFVSQPKALPEIWALGFRNPRHLSFDRLRGDLFVVDEGKRLTEINTVQREKNYGWSVMEGADCVSSPCSLINAAPPLFSTTTTGSFAEAPSIVAPAFLHCKTHTSSQIVRLERYSLRPLGQARAAIAAFFSSQRTRYLLSGKAPMVRSTSAPSPASCLALCGRPLLRSVLFSDNQAIHRRYQRSHVRQLGARVVSHPKSGNSLAR